MEKSCSNMASGISKEEEERTRTNKGEREAFLLVTWHRRRRRPHWAFLPKCERRSAFFLSPATNHGNLVVQQLERGKIDFVLLSDKTRPFID
jgi:hypothetical protein